MKWTQTLLRRKTLDRILEQEATRPEGERMHRRMTVRDLTAFGLAAIIGSGIYSAIGEAVFQGGPATSLLYVFTALACGLAALCYAEFASLIPISGSAYTYSYAAFGELFAWIIGWDLIIEYGIGNIAVAISWSDYFTQLWSSVPGLHWPAWLGMDALSAANGHEKAEALLAAGQPLPAYLAEARAAWQQAPVLLGLPLILDLPALLIVALITYIAYIGIRESKRAGNLMVAVKLLVLLVVVVLGAFFIDTQNWQPFAPRGWAGVMGGVAAVFFAYIGFDAISTTAEEAKNPQRDLPRATLYSLGISTLLYVLVVLVLTGMVPFTELKVGDPLAYVFEYVGLGWMSGIIAVSAVFAIASVLLVFQVGQPRIWMSMSRDGLLPPRFGRLHPRFRTPGFSTIMTGLLVGLPLLFVNLEEMLNLSSIGTIFAFVLVCGGILRLHQDEAYRKHPNRRFRLPYISARAPMPLLYMVGWYVVALQAPQAIEHFFAPTSLYEMLPTYLFVLVVTGLTVWAFLRSLSLIPLLGLICCLYLMSQLHVSNWLRFLLWLAVGLVIYFGYGRRHSRLNAATTPPAA
ncbi:MAG: APC family permease [Sphingobacteriia bacterium]|jgi:APA family basic amino acid/polyamine antiporter